MNELLITIASGLVENPDAVNVTVDEPNDEGVIVYHLHVAENDMNGLMLIGLIAVIINVLYFILIKVRMYTTSVISNKILLDIRQELYEHIQKLSFKFFDSRPTG